MSHRIRPAQPLEVRERATCMCGIGAACTSFAPGHALHLIQARLVSATPAEWVDAIVELADEAERTLVIRDLASGLVRTLWSGRGAAARVTPGDPVALHGRYHVLAVGTERFNVLAFD